MTWMTTLRSMSLRFLRAFSRRGNGGAAVKVPHGASDSLVEEEIPGLADRANGAHPVGFAEENH